MLLESCSRLRSPFRMNPLRELLLSCSWGLVAPYAWSLRLSRLCAAPGPTLHMLQAFRELSRRGVVHSPRGAGALFVSKGA